MSTRSYPDADGNLWTVWEVTPGENLGSRPGRRPYLPDAMVDGWLCFESRTGKRRLYPVPPRWTEKSDAELDGLCRAAEPVARATEVAATTARIPPAGTILQDRP